MGGIKNAYQQYGVTPMDMQLTGGTIYDRDTQLRTRLVNPYCTFCGNEIVHQATDEFGMKVDSVWERENQMHYRCLVKEQQGRR